LESPFEREKDLAGAATAAGEKKNSKFSSGVQG
jgi:hypothetical protein